jgi:hypothetical protein
MKPVPVMPNFRDATTIGGFLLLFLLPGGTLMLLIASWWIHRRSQRNRADEMPARFEMRAGLPKKDLIAPALGRSWDSENRAELDLSDEFDLCGDQLATVKGARPAASSLPIREDCP